MSQMPERNEAGPASLQGGAPGEGERGLSPAWLETRPTGRSLQGARSSNLYVLLLAPILLATLGTTLGFISWFGRVQTPLLFALMVTDYEQPWIIPVPMGQKDRDILTSGKVFDRVHPVPAASLDRQQILAILADVENVPARENVVVYVTARSVAGADGKLLLLPSDARVENVRGNPATLNIIPLDDLFRAMAKCPATHKLLVLDIFSPLISVPEGMLQVDLPGVCKEQLEAFQKDGTNPFHVLMTCAPGQRSFPSYAIGGSPFCHFLAKSINGQLPSFRGSNLSRYGKVYLSDLQDFLTRHVDRWTSYCNLARQTPMLLGSGPDMLLGIPKVPYVPSQVIAAELADRVGKFREWIPGLGRKKGGENPDGTETVSGPAEDAPVPVAADAKQAGGDKQSGTATQPGTEGPGKAGGKVPAGDSKKDGGGKDPAVGAQGDKVEDTGGKDGRDTKQKPENSPTTRGEAPGAESGRATKSEILAIPPEVEAAWALLEKWTDAGMEVDNPRLMNRLSDLARQGLLNHILGLDRKHYAERVQYETGLIRAEMERRKNELPAPTVYPTLAMMMTEGRLAAAPDARVNSCQKAILSIDPAKFAGADGSAQVQKASGDWAKANPSITPVEMELDCVAAMINLPKPAAGNWRAAAELLLKARGEPKTSEARLLVRLGLAMAASGCDPELAQTCLATCLRCNQAASFWRCYSRIGSIMEKMAENCSDGIWIVENSPRQHARQAADLLAEARRSAVFVEGFEQVYNEARKIIWAALQDFSAFESFPMGLPAGWDNYADRMGQLIGLFQELRSPQTRDRGEIERIVSRLRIAAQDLAKSYQEVHVAVQPEGIREFVRISGAGNVSPAILPEVESALRLGGQTLRNRLTLLDCYFRISQRIVDGIQALEDQEQASGTPAPARPEWAQVDPARAEQRARNNSERVKFIKQRLRLLGVPERELTPLQVAESPGPGDMGLTEAVEKGKIISRLFLARVPQLIESDPNAAFRANLAYPGWLFNKTLDVPGNNPAGRAMHVERENYLSWVVSRLRHESRLGLDKEFTSEMAGLFGHKFNSQGISGLVVSPAKPLGLQIPGDEKTVSISWTGDLDQFADIGARILQETQGPFTAAIRKSSPSGSGGVVEVAVRRDSSAVTPTLVGYEFILEFREGSRKWYGLLTILPDDDGSRPSLVISDPGEGGQVYGDSLLLRGSGSKKEVMVRLRQDSGKAENLAVTIRHTTGMTSGVWGPVNVALPTGVSTSLPFEGFQTDSAPSSPVGSAPERRLASSPRQMAAPGELLFEIRDLTKVSDPVVTRGLKVMRVDPGDLVEVLAATVSPARGLPTPASNLRVELRAKRVPLAGPPCLVELSLEGTGEGTGTRGNMRGTVPANGDPLVLEAQGIQPSGSGTGMFTLSVDGVPLTYRFSADFAVLNRVEGAALERVPHLGLKASMAITGRDPVGGMPASAGAPRVRVEAWASQAPAGASLRLKLMGGDQFALNEKLELLPGPLESVATLEPGEKGVWLLSLKEGRWTREWDSEGLAGRKQVCLELVGSGGAVLASKETELIIDASPPRFGQFFGFPEKVGPGTTSRFSFMVSDEESGISLVQAYLGPPKPSNPPAGNAPAAPMLPPPVVEVIPSGNAREVRLDVPVDAKGSVTLTIRAVNGSGLESIWSQAIPVADTPPPTLGGLRGAVTEGGRPQGGLTVLLKDEKGKEAQKAATDKTGNYQFEGLKPGKYAVEVKKPASGRSASAKLEIKAGPPAVANLNLLE